jgi:hypothetical protein
MTKLTQFFGTCVLVASLSGVALAGETMGPPLPPPPSTEFTSDCPETKAIALPQRDSSSDIVTAMDLAAWLVVSIQ